MRLAFELDEYYFGVYFFRRKWALVEKSTGKKWKIEKRTLDRIDELAGRIKAMAYSPYEAGLMMHYIMSRASGAIVYPDDYMTDDFYSKDPVEFLKAVIMSQDVELIKKVGYF